jgi:hypothetical protein
MKGFMFSKWIVDDPLPFSCMGDSIQLQEPG